MGLLALTIIHFIYEGIIAPSIRLNLLFQLFRLRDEIRNLKIKYGNQLNNEIYCYLEGSVNGTIKHLHLINLTVIYELYRSLQNNKELQNEIERRKVLLSQCSFVEVNDIVNRQFAIFQHVIFANAAGWFIYIVPPVMLFLFFTKCVGIIKNLFLLPEREVERFLPAEILSAV